MRRGKLPRIAGWLAVVGALVAFQGGAVLGSFYNTLFSNRVNSDSLQQIFPFFRYVKPTAFEGDYVADYYLACYPLGYRTLYVSAAAVGIDPSDLSRYLPHVLWLVTVACLGLVAYRLGGRLVALLAMAVVLGSNAYLERIGGGLPRGFGFPILAATLVSLAYARVGLCAACVLLGALFYPVTAVVSGLCLAGMLLLPRAAGLEVTSWSWARRLGFVAGTAALAVALLLPTAIASSRFGGVVRPDETHEFPEAGLGGRYAADSRPPFQGFFEAIPLAVSRTLFSAKRHFWEAGRLPGNRRPRQYQLLAQVLSVVVLVGGIGLVLRRPAARRVLLFGVAAFAGHALSCSVAPYAYLPERYVAYPVPLLATLAVSVCFVGLFPRLFDRGLFRHLKTLSVGAYVAALLVLLVGRVSPTIGLDVDLGKKRGLLFGYIGDLPPSALVAGWPSGVMNEVPYLTRRRVLVTFEVHQAFHKGYIKEMRRRMRRLIDAYFATSVGPVIRLRDELGVTHLIVQRSHFDANPPTYFRPFDRWITARRNQSSGKDFELPKLFETARVFSYRDYVLLDLRKIHADADDRALP